MYPDQSTSVDVTKSADDRYLNEAYRTLVDDSTQGLTIFQSGHFVFVNRAFAELAGAQPEDLLGYSEDEIKALFQPDEGEQPLVYFHSFPADLAVIRQELRMVSRDGVVTWVEMFVRPALYQGLPAVQAAFINISDRHRIQQALYESEQRHRLISNMISDFVYSARFATQNNFSTEWISGAFERITGFKADQIQASRKGWIDLIHPDDLDIALNAYQKAGLEGVSVVEYRIFTQYGRIVWLRDYLRSVPDERDPNITRLLGAVQDITPQKQAEQALKASEARWRSLVENAPAIIATLDQRGIVISVNRSHANEIPTFKVGSCLYDYFPPTEDEKLARAISEVFVTGRPAEIEVRYINENGHLVWFQIHAGPIHLEDLVESVVILCTDITERKHVEEKLRFFSTHDTLTGLYNRAFFEGEIERLQSSRQFPISIVVADVNGLKATNDRYGHAAGDDLLRSVAHVLRDSFRDEDVIARLGGDEFAIILLQTDEHTALEILERLRKGLADYNATNPPFKLSVAAGAATAVSEMTLLDIIKLADDRMYADKLEQKARQAMTGPSTDDHI
jgi:diguanylate cyclase (GGDEF)-like protein/PAS domain S-box-containing protein